MGGASGTTTTKKTKSTSNANNTSSTSLVPATILQRFWDLASTDAETRCTAAASLSEELFLVQNNTTSSITNDDDKNNVKLDAVVEYSMKRLTRGLGSGRAGARQGFAVAFTSAMTHLDAILRGRWISISEGRIGTNHEEHERIGSERYFDRTIIRERGAGESAGGQGSVLGSEEEEKGDDEW